MATEQLEFNVGEGESPATVEVQETEKPSIPEVAKPETGGQDRELDQYSDNVKKRIDKLTARLRSWPPVSGVRSQD